MDKTILKTLADKVEICSEWAKPYSKDLSNELIKITEQLRELKDV